MTEPLYADPVVAEIHAIRERLLNECDGDVAEFRKRLRERQGRSEREIVHGPVRKRTEQGVEPDGE